MTESDFEYLIRTLSEARSRATELTVAVRARTGANDRLADLGNSAVSNIEKLLREVRVLALDQAQSNLPDPRRDPAPCTAGVPPEHWIHAFIRQLTACAAGDDVSFQGVEQLLEQHKRRFLEDLETARRMYRVYPHLFASDNFGGAGAR